ncbi:MAG: (2Fe-2S)-binding protein [Bdellovibrionaceae bacterium]|nr:(2Fe-2S)-binding protein [Pseudobdellovibrionaceae bacterium]
MKVELPQLNKILTAEKDANLFKTLKEAQVPIASSCKGDGVCGKCVVRVESGTLPPPGTLELTLMDKYKLDHDQRISCQCAITSDLKLSTTYW